MSPVLTIDQNALLHNLSAVKSFARRHRVAISFVTKGLVGHEGLVKLLLENGVDSICDAHIQNLIKFKDMDAEKWLIRSPLISEADDVVCYADVSLVSEISVLERLSEAAVRHGRSHKVVIMLELGELREGCMPNELIPLCEASRDLPGLELHGIGTNLSCINEVVPDGQNMEEIVTAAIMVERALGVNLPVLSGGSSSSLKMLIEGSLPVRVNHLRIGEAILLGNIVCYDVPFAGARTDAFTLHAEVIEVKEKPSLPWGERAPGVTPIAQDPATEDLGIRKRALIAVGKQDVFSKYLIPLDPNIKILGDTSDCMIVDVTGSENEYKPGDSVGFRLRYNGLVSAMASAYIEKKLI